MILADTDVLIDYLAGTQPIRDEVRTYIQSDRLLTSAITCFELLSGAREGKRGDAVRRLIAAIPIRKPTLRETLTHRSGSRRSLAVQRNESAWLTI